MPQRLQHNLDVIHYMLKNASPDQLAWRSEQIGESLGDIITHLREVERWHNQVGDAPPPKDTASDGYLAALTDYMTYRRRTLQLLDMPRQQDRLQHPLFGELSRSELISEIDAYDRTHIRRMEAIMREMPLNPLLARALAEIAEYHRRYRPYLQEAQTLLDIGVGTGLALRHVMRQNPHLACAGVDVRDLRLPHMDVPLQLYDGHTLPYQPGQFDVSLLFYVLHHCHDPGRLLAEARRVTRHKLIIIEEFHHAGVDKTSLDLTERQSHRALGIPPDLPYQLFDKSHFAEMLQSCRLSVVEHQLLPSQTTRPVQKYLYVVDVD